MPTLTEGQVDTLVKNNTNVYWDGWDFVIGVHNHNAYTMKDGVFLNGSWHVAKRIKPETYGKYFVPKKLYSGLKV